MCVYKVCMYWCECGRDTDIVYSILASVCIAFWLHGLAKFEALSMADIEVIDMGNKNDSVTNSHEQQQVRTIHVFA